MVLQYKGGAAPPGTIGGLIPWTPWTQAVPGPLGFKQVEVKGAATKSPRALALPLPWHSSTIIRMAVVDWKLADGPPVTSQVRQGHLPNCPIAAILAALGNSKDGQQYLDGLITEYKGTPVKSSLPGELVTKLYEHEDDPDDYKPQAAELTSNRYFTVNLKKFGKPIEVHDTFYVEYTDGTYYKLVFMNSPNDVLWPAVIEKACAIYYSNSYPEMSNYKKYKANVFYELLTGFAVDGLDIKDDTDIEKIRDVAREAKRVPTIAASRDTDKMPAGAPVTPWHAHAVLGMTGKKIDLYDPAAADIKHLEFDVFRKTFQTMLFPKRG